jgi:hypothetical protein
MSKVKIEGHGTGTGTFTVTTPSSNTDRTITLPDATGTLLNSDGSAASLTAIPAANITGTLPAINGANLTGVNAVNGGRKNLIINGGMDVWQRATSFALTNGKAYTADRFWLNPQSVASTHSRQAVTSPIAGMASQYCLRIQRNINVSATGLIYFATDLESTNAFACRGRKLTLSFYARKHATGYTATSDLFSLGIVSGKGTDQTLVNGYTSGSYVANQSNTLTSSWQRFTVTTSSVIADDITQIGLQGTRTSVGTAGTNDYMEITGIQVEISDAATDFEHRSYGEELALCQRYYEVLGSTAVTDYGFMYIGGNWTTVNSRWGLQWTVTKRASPTITESGTWYVRNSTGSSIAVTAKNFDQPSPYGAAPYVTCASGLTVGHTAQIWGDDGLIKVDAEL